MHEKVVVIEDDKIVRDNIEIMLEEEGFNVFCLSSGKEGLKIIREVLPDVVVCDIMMPDYDGYEVLQQLHDSIRTKNIPFIFLTAKVEPKDLRKGMELGADDYIFKPFKADDLVNSIRTRLAKYEEFRTAPSQNIDESSSSGKGRFGENESILINLNRGKVKFIKISSIKYVQALNQYSKIVLDDGDSITLKRTLKTWEDKLPETMFVRIHRSYIINLNYIEKIEKWYNNTLRVHLKKVEEPFVISRNYAKKIKADF